MTSTGARHVEGGCSASASTKSSTVGPTGTSGGRVGAQGSSYNQAPRPNSRPAPSGGSVSSSVGRTPAASKPVQPSGTVNVTRIELSSVSASMHAGCAMQAGVPAGCRERRRSRRYPPPARHPERCGRGGGSRRVGSDLGEAGRRRTTIVSDRQKVDPDDRDDDHGRCRDREFAKGMFISRNLRAGHQERRCGVAGSWSSTLSRTRSGSAVAPSSSHDRTMR